MGWLVECSHRQITMFPGLRVVYVLLTVSLIPGGAPLPTASTFMTGMTEIHPAHNRTLNTTQEARPTTTPILTTNRGQSLPRTSGSLYPRPIVTQEARPPTTPILTTNRGQSLPRTSGSLSPPPNVTQAHVSVSNVDPVREFDEGMDGVLSCTVTGIPQPTVTWIWDSQDVLQTENGRFQKLPNDSLVIRNIRMSDAGVYQCVGRIMERDEEESLNTRVIVNYSPKLLQLPPEEVYTWLGNPINISCSVHSVPPATLTWIHNGQNLSDISRSDSGRDPFSVSSTIEVKVHEPIDWGVYTCLAVNRLGQVMSSTQVMLGDIPSIPQDVHVEPNSTSLRVSLVRPLSDGHLTLLGYTVQWRLDTETKWSSIFTSSDGICLDALRPSSLYHIRVAAENGKGLGQFSPAVTVSTLSQREPDPPSVSDRSLVEGNSYRIYFDHPGNGSNRILKYNIRYREEAAESWLSDSVNVTDSYVLRDLKWGTHYTLQVEAENQFAISQPQQINFTTLEHPQPPLPVNAEIRERGPLGTGAIAGIILGIFLVLFVMVDAACYYTNRCGILLCIAVHVLGQQEPGPKRLDQEIGVTVLRMEGHGNRVDPLENPPIRAKRSSDRLPLTNSE